MTDTPTTAETKKQEVEIKNDYRSALAKQTNIFTNSLVNTFNDIQLKVSDYQKICVANMIAKMSEMLTKEGLQFSSINANNITIILEQCAMLQLNIAAVPRECFIQFRNVKIGETWHKQFEFGIEGNGNDAILQRYGINVKDVKNPWVIREGDEFTYPAFNGLTVIAPTWQPKSYTEKVIRVVYPVLKNDDTVEWLIAERADVAKNLKAHIANNLLGQKHDAIRSKIIEKINNMSLDELLSDKELSTHISPAWLNGSSREDMILRKLKNNATKKYPKNFENAFCARAYDETFDDYEQYKKAPEVEEIDMTEKVETEIEKSIGSEKIISQSVIETEEIQQKSNSSSPSPTTAHSTKKLNF